MDEKGAVWLPVVGYEELYAVNNYCEVKSLNYHRTGQEKKLKPAINRDGYYRVCLHKGNNKQNHLTHVLGMKAFVPNPDNLPCINHKDENTENNYICVNEDGTIDPDKSNLEWCTHKYNINYGTRNRRTGDKLSIPVIQYTKEGVYVNEYKSAHEADRQTGISYRTINRCCLGKQKTAGGFRWEYK